jgi:hypothetical protein
VPAPAPAPGANAGSSTAAHPHRDPDAGTPERHAQLSEAQKLQAKSPSDAADRYRELAKGTDKVAARALEDLAYVELFHLRHLDEAIRLSEDYERRFPHGDDAADALWIRIEAYHDLGKMIKAHSMAAIYLQRFPKGQKVDRVRTIFAE